MRSANIRTLIHLSCPPNRDDDTPVIKVTTDYDGEENSFYMECADKHGNPVSIEGDLQGARIDENTIHFGDRIVYDKQDGFSKAVIWNGRKFRQRDYSFDEHKVIR